MVDVKSKWFIFLLFLSVYFPINGNDQFLDLFVRKRLIFMYQNSANEMSIAENVDLKILKDIIGDGVIFSNHENTLFDIDL